MPYGISDKQSDCSGWAAVKQESDGSLTTLECYPTKQEAIDRMVAQSLAEGMEPAGELVARAEGEIIVVDVDGTLLAAGNEPITSVIDAVNASEYPLVILTGRLESRKDETISALDAAGLRSPMRVIMKPDESIETPAFKKQSISDLLNEGYEISEFVDNDAANRAAVAELGVEVYSPEEFVADSQEEEEPETEIEDQPSRSSEKRNDQLIAFVDAAIAVLMQAKQAYSSDEEEEEPEEMPMEEESRAVDLKAPAFMRASARRGLALHEQGLSGDGLKSQTVEDARKMAAGDVTEDKWRKIAPWIARHIVDLDAVQGDEVTPGLVAMLLWGGGSTKASALRAQQYAERIVERLDADK